MTSFETYILPPTPPEGEMPTLNPLVKVLDTDEVSYGKFALEPLTKGYGITIGNPCEESFSVLYLDLLAHG